MSDAKSEPLPEQMVWCGIGHEELTCTDGVVWYRT